MNRWFRGLAIATLVLADVVLVSFALPVQTAAEDQCGAWRWSVKTLSDSQAAQVNFVPVARTITQLRGLHKRKLGPRVPRIDSVEFTTYRVRGRLIEYKQESDRDFHVVIAQPNRPNRRMVVEVVDPTCPGARESTRVGAFRAVRQEFINRYGQPSSSKFTEIPMNPTAFVIGVGFFDEVHGQKGAAPNGIELHPVLDVQPVP